MVVFFGTILTTATWESNGDELPQKFHQAAIFNAPVSPDLRVEPSQPDVPILERTRMQSIQHTINGSGFEQYGNNQLFLIIGLVLYFLVFSLRKWSGNGATGPMYKLVWQAKLLSSKYFQVMRKSSSDFDDIGSMRSSLSQELRSLQAPFLAIKDSVEAAKQRIRDGIEAEGQPTQNSAAIFEALGDIEKAANGVVAITQEGIESVEREADSAVTRERIRMLAGAIGGAAMAATEIIASRQLWLVSINSATAATENGGRSRLLAETVARAIPMPRSGP
jgi:hypothetical protein